MALTTEERQANMARARAAKATKGSSAAAIEQQIRAARQKAEMKAAFEEAQNKDFAELPDRQKLDGGEFAADAGITFAGSAEYVVIYDVNTGETSRTRAETVVSRLMPDKSGKIRFTETPKNKAWKYRYDPITDMPVLIKPGRMCLLHPDHPNREWYDEIGLADRYCDPENGRHCTNLPNEFEVRQHMAFKHRQEWAVIQGAEADRKDREARDREAKLYEAIARR